MKKLKVAWHPKIEDDLHSFIVCKTITQVQADVLLQKFKQNESRK